MLQNRRLLIIAALVVTGATVFTCRPSPEAAVQKAEEKLAAAESRATRKVYKLRADQAERISSIQTDARKAVEALQKKVSEEALATQAEQIHAREADRIAKVQQKFETWIEKENRRVEDARKSVELARLQSKEAPAKGPNGGELLIGALVESTADMLAVRDLEGDRHEFALTSASKTQSKGRTVVLKLCQQGTPLRVEMLDGKAGTEARTIDVLSLESCEATALAD